MGNYCSRCRNFMGGKYTLIINVLNKDLVPVTFIDNDIPGLPSYYKDTLIDYLSLGTASFEFTILKSKNNIIQDYSRFFNDETCFSFEKNGKQYAVFPAGSDGFYETDTEITYKCLSLDRELSLEYVDKFDNSSTHTLQWYIDYFELISNNQIEIGRNDVADYTRVIKYDSQDTKLNRLLSLINNFDAEFEFITKLTNNGAVDKIILNIVKKRDDSGKGGIGAIRDDVELVYGKNVKGIERTYNFEFFNASKVIGKDGTNWNSSEFSYINSDGVEEFYKRKNDDTAFAPLSAQKYPAHLRKDSSDIWLRKNFETEYTTPAQMWGYIVQQFKSYAYPQITYKIKTNSNLVSQALDGKLPIQIGDTVTIEDDNFSNEQGDFGLILRARATEIKSSDSNPETNEITFENFVELQNDLSDDLMTQVNQLVDAATPFRAELSTTNGTQFKNGTGSTTLSAHIFKGSATTETVADSYEWSKDGTVVANAQTITVDASGVVDKAVYSFKATVGGKVVASQSVTITNVNDGTNGRSVTNVSQKWRLTTTTATPTQAWSDAGWLTTQPTTTATNKYLWSITRTTFNLAPLTQDVIEQKAVYGDKGDKGDTGNDGIAGKDGVGIKTTVITYAISTSGTIAPNTGWTSSVPSLVKGQYLWTKTVWNYSDGTSESGYTVTYIAKDGNNGNDGIAGKDGVGLINTTLRYAKSKDGVNKPEGRIVASFTDKFIPARSIIDNLIMTGKQVHLEQGKTYILSAETNGIFTNVHNVEQSNNATIWIVNPSFSTWDIISDTNTAIGTKYTHNRPTGDYEIRINSYEIDNSIWVKNIVFEDGTWTPDIPVANPGEYLWTRTTWFYSDNTNETGFSVAKMGEQGPKGDPGKDGIAGKDGVGIKTTVITYAISTNETTAPATGWTSSVPSLVKGQYLWTKTVWTYTDNSSETGYSVTYISKDGNNGTNGIAGKDGVGIKTTTITYAGSTNGTTAPNTGWTSTVPTVAAGNYLWTKTVWAYTDNTSETGYSVAMMGVKGERGKQIFKSSYESVPHNNFHYWSDLSPAPSIDNPPKIGDTVITPSGNILQIDTVNVGGGGGGGTFGVGDVLGNIKGPSGSNGDPGKVVSDTEPTTRFKGLTWKYSGTTDLTASDGTVIKPNVEYYYNGTHWVINYFSVNNFAAESITSDKIDGKNLTITDGEFISKTTNGPVTTSTEIKDNHISISKTDGTVNTRNDIALDSEQGLAQKFTNINTGFYRTAGINYQGPFTSDSDGNFAQLTPQGTKLSTDVPWTKLSLMNNFNGNIEYAIINGTVYISASGVGVPAMTAGQWKQAAQLPTGSSAIPIRANRIAAGDSGDGLSWALLSNQAGGIFIRCSGNKSPTANLFNATLPYPIG
ncbi:putative receptor binding protein [Lactococcus phage 28201]|uniref:tail fiber protein; host specificity n=1 Tax=Lactococcus phage 28201 TaxID=1871678 RepID=UPI00080968A0|nr:tail fiber protein; host specificity [Lactococcus phage 28201]ANS02388.1 putative receptor binding protein [Lactococcus phage 28201]ANS02593.1 putative receptor binding protein [Lactococcus phage 62501]